jgi:transposase
MPRAGPRKLHRYSDEFKLTAVRLSQQPGIQVQTVAAALEIHPFMLSKWRKDMKDGRLRGRPKKAPPAGPAREIAQLQALERKYAQLQEEHDLLKKAIRFWGARTANRKATGSPSSITSSRSMKATLSLRSVVATPSRPVGSTRGGSAKPKATTARTRTRTGR